MHVHELVEGKLVPLVHARHPGGEGGLMLEVGGGKETVLVGHRVDQLADVGGRHGAKMRVFAGLGNSGLPGNGR